LSLEYYSSKSLIRYLKKWGLFRYKAVPIDAAVGVSTAGAAGAAIVVIGFEIYLTTRDETIVAVPIPGITDRLALATLATPKAIDDHCRTGMATCTTVIEVSLEIPALSVTGSQA
jgi:hypothetical protein